MPKSKDPSTYHPINKTLFEVCNQTGHVRTDPMTKTGANSLRFDLNGYRTALKLTNHPDYENIQYSSVSIRKIDPKLIDPQSPHLTHYIEIFPAGPAWTEPETYKAVMNGIAKAKAGLQLKLEGEKEKEQPAAQELPFDIEAMNKLLEESRPKGTDETPKKEG